MASRTSGKRNASATKPAGKATTRIKASAIARDESTQIRVKLHRATVAQYAEMLRQGGRLPAPVVFEDAQGQYWLADGHHTLEALRRNAPGGSLEMVEVEVRNGSRDEAFLHAVHANTRHGIPLSNADKRKVVDRLLRRREDNGLSDRAIAEQLNGAVSHAFVSKCRRELCGEAPRPEMARRRRTAVNRLHEPLGAGTAAARPPLAQVLSPMLPLDAPTGGPPLGPMSAWWLRQAYAAFVDFGAKRGTSNLGVLMQKLSEAVSAGLVASQAIDLADRHAHQSRANEHFRSALELVDERYRGPRASGSPPYERV